MCACIYESQWVMVPNPSGRVRLIKASCFCQLPCNPPWVVGGSGEGKERDGGAGHGQPGPRGEGARAAAILPWWRRGGVGEGGAW